MGGSAGVRTQPLQPRRDDHDWRQPERKWKACRAHENSLREKEAGREKKICSRCGRGKARAEYTAMMVTGLYITKKDDDEVGHWEKGW